MSTAVPQLLSPRILLGRDFNVRLCSCVDSLAGPYTGDRYPSYETPRADNYGCYCVPYDQCLPHEVARKEDGIAGIDPRNLQQAGKPDIEAIGLDEVVITDGNGTIVSHHKVAADDDKAATKTRRRRDVAQSKSDAEPVSASLPLSSRRTMTVLCGTARHAYRRHVMPP